MPATNQRISVSRSEFKREEITDESPDLSFLGEYSNSPEDIHIDREERGDCGRGEYRYFNAGCGDPDYIEDDYKRAEAYNRGDWYMLGIRASATVRIPRGDHSILQKIESPGLWGIESDSGDSYFAEVFAEESNTLAEMLESLGVEVID